MSHFDFHHGLLAARGNSEMGESKHVTSEMF